MSMARCASTVKQAPVGIGFQRRADVRRYFSFMPRCARTYAWRVICQNLLAARFSGAERHRRRLYKLAALGN
jgi:hypothetical protein